MPEQPSPSEATQNYYQLLGLTPTASVQQIRRAYRELSKLYHPDTTQLPAAVATARFQQLNEAYATLSSPERRASYDLKIGYSRVTVIQPPAELHQRGPARKYRSSAYLDPSDRPLSAGELFALFVLGLTFVGCLVLVITIGMTRGEIAFQSVAPGQLAETARHSIQRLHPSAQPTDFPSAGGTPHPLPAAAMPAFPAAQDSAPATEPTQNPPPQAPLESPLPPDFSDSLSSPVTHDPTSS